MSLAPGTRLGPYEIVSLLGAGGMGEVYLAHDPRLGRHVAVKILPAAFSADPDRLWRFEREARAVASLNHPHICTVHDIGEHEGHRFLVMERLEGEPLDSRLESGPLPAPLLLDLAVQIADALDAAHSAGVIHRDLKPANIFVTKRGEAKLLDFGLAKLAATEDQEAEVATLPPGANDLAAMPKRNEATSVGMVMGTAAYMSPEQARAEPVDAQTDLFSFGAVLYEMATGTRAFTGKTMATLFDQILNRDPQPIASINPAAPAELAPIVSKALEKEQELRYRTAADMGADLKRLRRDSSTRRPASEIGTTSVSGSAVVAPNPPSGTVAQAPVTPPPAMSSAVTVQGRSTPWPYIVAASLAVVVALSGFAIWQWRGSQGESRVAPVSLDALQVQQITSSGTAFRPAVSPDGKYVVYFQNDGAGGSNLWLRQVSAANSVKIIGTENGLEPFLATVGPDGTFIDVVRSRGSVARVPFLGGTPKVIVELAVTPLAWSPDGKQMAYIRPAQAGLDLVVADPNGTGERVVATRDRRGGQGGFITFNSPPGVGAVGPAWSPDGRRLAALERLSDDIRDMGVEVFDVASGESTIVKTPGDAPQGLAWLDAATLLVGQALEAGTPSQLWRVSYPDGRRTRLTNDVNRYSDLSVSADSNTFVTSRTQTLVSLWVGDGKGQSGREVLKPSPFLSSAYGYATVAWDGARVLFTHTLNGRFEIFRVDPSAADSTPEAIVAGREMSVAPDGSIVYRSVTENTGLFRVNRDGQRPVELLKGAVNYPFVTPDGTAVIFNAPVAGSQRLLRLPMAGGTPVDLTNVPVSISGFSDVSPDGRWIAIRRGDWFICELPECINRKTIGPISGDRVHWTPDGKGLAYADNTKNTNIWIQPIDGKPAYRLTHLAEDRTVAGFAWSRDGQKLAIAQSSELTSDIVLFTGLKGK